MQAAARRPATGLTRYLQAGISRQWNCFLLNLGLGDGETTVIEHWPEVSMRSRQPSGYGAQSGGLCTSLYGAAPQAALSI